ncbi:MAG: GIY-YIG nuclease family protein [Parcubacteria group bacterium]|jgi:putative endonuclease
MYTTYVIKNNKNKKYTGSTENLEDRLRMHNDINPEKAKFHRTTYNNGPWKILFQKDFNSRKEALEFERFLKTGKGREWLERARLGG